MLKGFKNIFMYLFFPSIFTMLFTTNVNSKKYVVFMFIAYILLLTYFLFKYKNEIKKDIKSFNKKYLKVLLIYELLGFILMIFTNYIINYLIIPNGISSNELGNRELLLNNKIIYSFMLCLLTPIIEEISFRLEFKKNIKNKYLFIILSSLIFASVHLISITKLIELLYLIPYLILGLTFTLIYQKTDNIISNILAHILHNTIIVLIILIF